MAGGMESYHHSNTTSGNSRSGGAPGASSGGGGLPTSESFSCSDPTKLTDSELDCLKEAFSLFDADHDGEITVGELGRVMRNHGLNPTDDELKDMIRNVDKNSNGAIDFNEFIEMMLARNSKGEEDVVHAFRVFDRDGDGLISAEELKLTMNNLGEPLTDYEVRSMIEAADLDGDGRINFQEFARLMHQGGFDNPAAGGGAGPSAPGASAAGNHRAGSTSSSTVTPSSGGAGGASLNNSSSAKKNGKCV